MRALFLWIHLLAAMVWVGGMAFLAFVVVPYARGLDDRTRGEMIQGLGQRFRLVGWIAVGVLAVTGVFNMIYAGLNPLILFDPTLTRSSYGRTLAWKLLLFLAMVGVALYHDLVVGSRLHAQLRALEQGAAEGWDRAAPTITALRGKAAMMGRVSFLLALVIVYLGVRLTRP